MTEFKRRNGFEKIDFPKYYVPLTAMGRLWVASRLHRGLGGLIPEPILETMLDWRARWYRARFEKRDCASLGAGQAHARSSKRIKFISSLYFSRDRV